MQGILRASVLWKGLKKWMSQLQDLLGFCSHSDLFESTLGVGDVALYLSLLCGLLCFEGTGCWNSHYGHSCRPKEDVFEQINFSSIYWETQTELCHVFALGAVVKMIPLSALITKHLCSYEQHFAEEVCMLPIN